MKDAILMGIGYMSFLILFSVGIYVSWINLTRKKDD